MIKIDLNQYKKYVLPMYDSWKITYQSLIVEGKVTNYLLLDLMKRDFNSGI